MKLVIVESPAKAKTIGKYLGAEYKVLASVGHVRDLPKSNKDAIDIAAGFVPRYVVSKDKEHIISELKSASKRATEVLLATDPDREGEAIAWHLVQALGLENKGTMNAETRQDKEPITQNTKSAQISNSKFQIPVHRVVFHEITERAIREAMQHPREIDQHLRMAQEARRVLDRLVGYDLSGLIWKKVRYGLSAGRVQSPALRIIVEREREIRAFVPEAYWVITAQTKTAKGEDLELTYAKDPKDDKEKDRIIKLVSSCQLLVSGVEEKQEQRNPKAPFTTSTLQQASSSRLGFAPSRTMRAAQKLYEAGHITYMRTDSTNLGKEAVQEMVLAIAKEFGRETVEERVYKTKSKNAQEAHEAIRPTKALTARAGTGEDEKKLYALIRSRTLASQMKAAMLSRTKVSATVHTPPQSPTILGEEVALEPFVASGVRVVSPGWLLADPAAKGDDVILPKVGEGEELKLISIDALGKMTEGPGRYSEAGLVKELEKRGIGRPSTYASIIATLLTREYVEKEGKSLKPTDTGEVVSSFLEKHFADVISDTFTAEMEEELDEIARGEREYEPTLRAFYGPFTKSVAAKEDIPKVTTLGDAPDGMLCPTCNGKMILKLGRSGTFYSCTTFPVCKGARMMNGDAMEGPKETGESCPECKEGKLVERQGRFGTFVACARYPKCKYVVKDEKSQKTTGVKCPKCNKGELAERKGRFGIFYSCTNYPDCKSAINAKPTGARCSYLRDKKPCEALMVEGTKTIPERCSDKTCPNNRPDKLAVSRKQ